MCSHASAASTRIRIGNWKVFGWRGCSPTMLSVMGAFAEFEQLVAHLE
jgi:hypothetical protein